MGKSTLNAETKVQIIELHKIDKELTGNYLIHLTADEWHKTTNGIPVVDYDGKLHPENGLLVVPVDPYSPDLGVIVIPAGMP